ncbi:hypothetical protein SDC9_142375 [bioreactor metagenome]|uniref:Uncharacterized protein n=1 Tax=bioreactor metagenome TaxID=1076179 RepID=A0A645E3S7_9ZZZZ
MMKKIHILFTYFSKIILTLDLHRLCLNPFAVFPKAAFCRHLADIYFRIEVCRKRISVIASIAIKNIKAVYFIELVFLCICGENARYTRIETASE